jgi:hypothetical protein
VVHLQPEGAHLMRRAWPLQLAMVLVVLMGWSRWALGAPADVDIVGVKWGFCDGLVPERWTPIVFSIASDRDGFSGTMSVTYDQDASQRARVTVPVATTPGATTSVEVVVCASSSSRSMQCQFVDSQTGAVRTIDFEIGGSAAPGAMLRDLPPLDSVGRRVLSVDGPRSLEEVTEPRERYSGIQGVGPGQKGWESTWRAQIAPHQMPLSWAAYDSVDVVVVTGDLGLRSDNRIDPRALEALMAWVRSGGRLVVIVETAGDGWMRFVDRARPVDVDEQGPLDVPEKVKSVLRAGEAPISAAQTTPVRLMRLRPDGERLGWQIKYQTQLGPGPGTVAHGPVGLGMVMLVACDPAKMSATVSSEASRRVWRDLLEDMLLREHDRTEMRNSSLGMYGGESSGGSIEAQMALGQVLSEVTAIPRLGHGAFVSIVLVVFVLAMLVGPVDAIVLKKLGWRHHSWAVALGWIALASLLCVIAPSMVHSGTSKVFRVASYDAIVSKAGSVVSASREGVTSMLPGRSSRLVLKDEADGATHRGVSPLQTYRGASPAGTVLPMHQGTIGKGSLRGAVPAEMTVKQWSVRATMDQAPVGLTPALGSLKVWAERGEPWRVRLDGLPAGATCLRMALETAEGWMELKASTRPGEWESAASPSITSVEPWTRWRYSGSSNAYGGVWTYGTGGSLGGTVSPGRLGSLPGAATRRDAITRLIGTQRWVCVHALCHGWPSDVTPISRSGVQWEIASQAVLRLVVPLDAVWRSGESEGRDAP